MEIDEQHLANLMSRIQAGDGEAYRQFLDLLYKIIEPMVRKRTAHNQDDLVQEIMFSVHEARHTYDPGRRFLPWLHAIVFHRVGDQKRSYWRHQRRIQAWQDDGITSGDGVSGAVKDQLLSEVRDLPETQREVITMLKYHGYSLVEVAEKLGISVAGVKNRAYRAYQTLRDRLTESAV